MPCALAGSGGGPDATVATGAVPTCAGCAGAGEVEILGALVTLNAWVAASCSISCWRSCTSTLLDLPLETRATAAPSGSVTDPGRPVMNRIATVVTDMAAAAAVTMKTPTRLRRRRVAWGRLLCCDNAVLPSAKRYWAKRPARGPLRYRAASRATVGLKSCCQERSRFPGPAPSRHNVARTGRDDQAFPPKKLGWKRIIGVAQITVWQYVL